MTQILNVPMPADEAIDLIRSIYKSNRMIDIEYTTTTEERNKSYSNFWQIYTDKKKVPSTRGIYVQLEGDRNADSIIINSITPIIPTYSVWDEVMILATGEIGEIIRQDRQYARDCYIAFPDEKIWHRWENYHRWEICKIAQK